MTTRELKDSTEIASTTAYGVAKLAASGVTTAGLVVQGNDARLTAAADLAAHMADAADAHDASAISFAPVGTIAATDAQAAIAEVASEAAAALTAHTGDTTDAHAASAIGFTPNGSIAATTVQLAIQEVRDEAASSFDLPGSIHAATVKATPVDADEFGYDDSAASFGLVRATWANLKAAFKTYYDTLYAAVGHVHAAAAITYSNTTSGLTATDAQAAIDEVVADLASGTAPTGAAGGVLSGSYPDPGFAADMATQAELDAHTTATAAHGATGAVVGTTNVQTLTNKTLTAPVITNLPTPSAAGDAASKAYVDAVAQGLSAKTSARLATVTALPASTYNNGSSGSGATLTGTATGVLTVDGSAVASGDRLLVKDQTGSWENGIYTCTTAGATGVAFVLTRSTDLDVPAEVPGAFVFIEAGTVNTASGWVCTNTTPPTFGSTALTFVQFSGAGEITAGSGLTKTGNTLALDTESVQDIVGALVAGAGGTYNDAGNSITLPTLGTLTIQEVDGTPTGSFGTLKLPNGTLTDNGDGSVTYTPAGTGGALSVQEIDGTPSDSAVTSIKFPNDWLTIVGHVVTVAPPLYDRLGQKLTPPTASTFGTWVNQGIAAITDADGYVRLSSAAESTDSWHLRTRALTPGSGYTREFGLVANVPPANFGGVAIGWRESSTGKMILCCYLFNGTSGQPGYQYSTGDNVSAPSSFALTANRTMNVATTLAIGEWPYWRLREDATTRYWEVSKDKQNWMRLFSEGRTVSFTPDQIVIAVEARNAGNHEVSLDIPHYAES
jgi:hypothetical protein